MRRTLSQLALAALLLSPPVPLLAQVAQTQPVTLDRVVATVDRRVIMASDVEQEVAFMRLYSGKPAAGAAGQQEQSQALERLITKKLMMPHIRENAIVAPDSKENAEAVQRLPESLHVSAAEWSQMVRRSGLDEADIVARVADGLTTERFIDSRFRPGVVITAEDIEKYYNEKFAPQMRERGSPLPELKTVSGQIEQILSEQKLTELVSFWVRGLRSQARIRSVDPAYPVENASSEPERDPRYLPLRISPPQTASVKSQAAAPAGGASGPASQPQQ